MWAWGFTSAALSWAAVLYDLTIDTALSKVLAVCLIALACIINVVLVARTCAGVLRLKVFIPEHKWGPMSHLPLAQEGMRHALGALTDTVRLLCACCACNLAVGCRWRHSCHSLCLLLPSAAAASHRELT
jgi:lysylphosphatidylglycerol synthetase-like protein (DUF2156 family)